MSTGSSPLLSISMPQVREFADIQHQIHVDRPVEPGGRFAVHEGEAQSWRPHRSLQQGRGTVSQAAGASGLRATRFRPLARARRRRS